MALMVELSGESLDLARYEADVTTSTLASARTDTRAIDGPVMIVEAPGVEAGKLASRLGLAHHVSDQARCGDLASAIDLAAAVDIGDVASFRVRVRRSHSSTMDVTTKNMEATIGALLKERTGARVDLTHPDAEVRLVLARNAYAGLLGGSVDRRAMEERAVRHRPFSRPVSIHPKLARVMVNLAGVSEGGRILDPLCGTGGILIEAALMGFTAMGSDIDPRMVKGSRKNLDALGLDADLQVADVTNATDGMARPPGAIVTDPPYGRSTSLFGERAEGVLEGLYGMAASILPDRGSLVVCLPDTAQLPPEDAGFEVSSIHPMKVHRSLTRHICVLFRDFQ